MIAPVIEGVADAEALAQEEDEMQETDVIESEAVAESAPAPLPTIVGFCKWCGIAVNEENVGGTTPAVLCKPCLEILKKEHEEEV